MPERLKRKIALALGIGALTLAPTLAQARTFAGGGTPESCINPMGPKYWECQGYHPQIAEALDVFQRNGIDILDIQLLSPKTIINQHATLSEAHTYPDYLKSSGRSVEITGPSSGKNFPSGDFALDMPAGRFPMLVRTRGPRYQGGEDLVTTWVYLHIGESERASLRGFILGWTSTTTGPVAFPISYRESNGNIVVLAGVEQPNVRNKIHLPIGR